MAVDNSLTDVQRAALLESLKEDLSKLDEIDRGLRSERVRLRLRIRELTEQTDG